MNYLSNFQRPVTGVEIVAVNILFSDHVYKVSWSWLPHLFLSLPLDTSLTCPLSFGGGRVAHWVLFMPPARYWLDLVRVLCGRQRFAAHLPASSPSLLSASSFRMFLSPVGVDTDVPFRAGHSAVPESQHFDQLWVSTLPAANAEEAPLAKVEG